MAKAAEHLTTRQYERTQYTRCYTIGHAWFDYDSSDWNPQWGLPLVLRCERCGSERRDKIGNRGEIIGRSYFYPEGYKYSKGTRPTKNEFRQMLLAQRILEQRATRRKAGA